MDDITTIARKAGMTYDTVSRFFNRRRIGDKSSAKLRAMGLKPYKPYEFLKPDRS